MLMSCVLITFVALIAPWFLPTSGSEFSGMETIAYALMGLAIIGITWAVFGVWRYVL